jgi:hypothetical protein
MKLAGRFLVVSICLALGVIAQLGLLAHLGRAEAGSYPELRGNLDDFPRVLNVSMGKTGPKTVWQSIDRSDLSVLRARLPFVADGLVSRNYGSRSAGHPLYVYMVYSRLGEDRKHHPEICIREVTGAPEDLQARRRVLLDSEESRPVQRFRFRTGTSEYTTVYYWHYTLDPELSDQQTFVQSLHLRLSRAAPSVTIQVSSLAGEAALEDVEKGFLPALDAVLREAYLPPTARMGCDRLPIALVRE